MAAAVMSVSAFQATAEDVVINLTEPGTLALKAEEIEVPRLDRLTITGPMNAADIKVLNSGTGYLGAARILDISGISLIPGDESYAKNSNSQFFIGEPHVDISYSQWLGSTITHYAIYGMDLANAFSKTQFQEIILPDCMSGIGSNMFRSCTNLTKICLPESITYIGKEAFDYCKALCELSMPESVDSIADNAFKDCYELPLPDLSKVRYFGNKSFHNCRMSGELNLSGAAYVGDEVFTKDSYGSSCDYTRVIFGHNLKHLGERTFGSTELTAVDMPVAPESMWNNTFPRTFNDRLERAGHVIYFKDIAWLESSFDNRDTDLDIVIREGTRVIADGKMGGKMTLKSVTLPSTLQRIGSRAFSGTELKSLSLPQSVKYIGCDAFYGCTLEKLILPKEITEIWAKAFANSGLASVTIPESVKIIGDQAFYGCNIGDIVFPDGVESIGAGAFDKNNNLYFERLPSSLRYIGKSAISSNAILMLTIPESLSYAESAPFILPKLSTLKIYARDLKSPGLYLTANKMVVGSSVRYLRDFCDTHKIEFEDRTEPLTFDSQCLRNFSGDLLNMPHDIDSIGDYAFEYADAPQSIDLSGLIGIGHNAFYSSKIPLSATMPKVRYIGSNAFSFSNISGNLAIPRAEYIEDGAFSYCRNLTGEINLPMARHIGAAAFRECVGMSGSISVPVVEHIEAGAFRDCSNINGEVTLPEALQSIGEYVFSETPLTKITWRSNAPLEKRLAPTTVETVVFGATIDRVPDNFCRNITNLRTVFFEESPARAASGPLTIGSYAFDGCALLKMPELPSRLKSIEEFAFCDVNPDGMIVPENVKYIGPGAFTAWPETSAVYFTGTMPPDVHNSFFTNIWNAPDLRFYVKASFLDDYLKAPSWHPDITLAMPEIVLPEEFVTIVGKEFELPYTITASEPSMGSLTWQSSDPAVVMPSDDGSAKMKALELGTAVISASATEGPARTVSCLVTVKDSNVVSDVISDKTEIRTIGNMIIVAAPANNTVAVFAADGNHVYSGIPDTIGPLQPGIYIVMVGNIVSKIVIK